MENPDRIVLKSSVGNILIEGTTKYITAVHFLDDKEKIQQTSNPLLRICANQLDEYFKGKRKKFSIPLQPQATEFQQLVWAELGKIQFGHLQSYEDTAIRIRDKKSTRAVANAVGKNKIAIIIPCHRVIGKNGNLTGYAGGLWRKQWLIEHEQYYLLNFNDQH